MNETTTRAGLLEERAGCPSCGNDRSRRLVDLAFDGEPLASYFRTFYDGRLDPGRLAEFRFLVDRCTDCGLIFQRNVPTASFLAELYDDVARGDPVATDRDRGLEVRRNYAYDVEQLIKYWGGVPGDVRVLDYGSGFGMWLRMAGAYGCHTTAAELSTAKAGAAPADAVISVDALPSDSFHFINTEQVLEHLVGLRSATEALARALCPGGLLRISVPNGGAIEANLQTPDWSVTKGRPGSLNPIAPLEHINCFHHDSLAALGAGVGLEPFHYPFPQFLERGERARHIAAAALHTIWRPRGTLLYFRRPR